MNQKTLILGNWKMNGTVAANTPLLDGLSGYQGKAILGVLPPALYALQAASTLKNSNVGWGGQNCSTQSSGAFTGEISANMISDLGATWCLTGHSERRALYGESNEVVALKTKAILAAGLVPVICIGETLDQRQSNQTERVLKHQIDAIFHENAAEALNNAVIAYEPVWAIGTGMAATPEQAQQTHAFIRGVLKQHAEALANLSILYGGSMKPENAADLLSQPDINGGLIGGASLKAEAFLAIADA